MKQQTKEELQNLNEDIGTHRAALHSFAPAQLKPDRPLPFLERFPPFNIVRQFAGYAAPACPSAPFVRRTMRLSCSQDARMASASWWGWRSKAPRKFSA